MITSSERPLAGVCLQGTQQIVESEIESEKGVFCTYRVPDANRNSVSLSCLQADPPDLSVSTCPTITCGYRATALRSTRRKEGGEVSFTRVGGGMGILTMTRMSPSILTASGSHSLSRHEARSRWSLRRQNAHHLRSGRCLRHVLSRQWRSQESLRHERQGLPWLDPQAPKGKPGLYGPRAL